MQSKEPPSNSPTGAIRRIDQLIRGLRIGEPEIGPVPEQFFFRSNRDVAQQNHLREVRRVIDEI